MEAKEKGFKNANSIKLYYEIYGSGEPLVLIHGGGSSGFFDYEEVVKRLSGNYMLLLIDLQNHGRSEHRTIPQTFEQDARDIVAVLDELKIVKASFWGFSNGGTTVLNVAYLFPERINKIIAASAVTKRSGLIDGFFEAMKMATLNNMPQYLKANFLNLNPDPLKLQNMFEKDCQRMIHFEDMDDSALQSIKVPVFFISGDQDVMKAAHIVEMQNLVPQSRILILPVGHGAYMMADENGAVDKALIDFTTNQVNIFLQR